MRRPPPFRFTTAPQKKMYGDAYGPPAPELHNMVLVAALAFAFAVIVIKMIESMKIKDFALALRQDHVIFLDGLSSNFSIVSMLQKAHLQQLIGRRKSQAPKPVEKIRAPFVMRSFAVRTEAHQVEFVLSKFKDSDCVDDGLRVDVLWNVPSSVYDDAAEFKVIMPEIMRRRDDLGSASTTYYKRLTTLVVPAQDVDGKGSVTVRVPLAATGDGGGDDGGGDDGGGDDDGDGDDICRIVIIVESKSIFCVSLRLDSLRAARANDQAEVIVSPDKQLVMHAGTLYEMYEPFGFVDPDCVVCLTEPKQVVLLPCRHFCVCAECYSHIDKCPVCRSGYDSVLLIKEKNDGGGSGNGSGSDGSNSDSEERD